ncbi:hypothetical protein VTN77DRAFT_535 [Rasamsonia byssochlamydoides]|uniref:uncharacterized protein n=1 Tax=Rasamsonia byssochlamydoides TaxID=89139 RepID=UPI00374387B1
MYNAMRCDAMQRRVQSGGGGNAVETHNDKDGYIYVSGTEWSPSAGHEVPPDGAFLGPGESVVSVGRREQMGSAQRHGLSHQCPRSLPVERMCWERLKYSVPDRPFYSVPGGDRVSRSGNGNSFKPTYWDMSSGPRFPPNTKIATWLQTLSNILLARKSYLLRTWRPAEGKSPSNL